MARLTKKQLDDNMQKLLDAEKPQRKKFRKARKPMTPEQKAAAAERLAAARAKKNAGKPAKRRYHEAVYDDKAVFKLENVLKWLATAKEQASNFKRDMRGKSGRDLQKANDKYLYWYGYYNDINWYLKHGDWISNTYGEDQQMKTVWRTVVPAYYPDGVRKDQAPSVIIEDKPKPKRKRKAK